ncbi:MAG: class I SAM-dependent methyltransferase [Kangiellaceae bacterium]|nr:class I SAM-dependent methyltransferase [Kangiellaceae bacterium]MCW8997324.1 class I SAM-dependent methyltransferase [Kangiellaceae bacterium]
MNYSKHELLNLYSDADFYDAEFKDRRIEIEFYKKLCSGKEKVLEVACGTGRITIPLAKSGINISGTDISKEMIANANKNARKANAFIDFSTEDARFTNGKFDLIFIATNAFQHFLSYDDALEFLNACYSSLNLGGSLVIDLQIPNVEKLARNQDEIRAYKKFTYQKELVEARLRSCYYNLSQIYHFEIEYLQGDRLIKRKDVAMRMYFPQELRLLFETTGFTIAKEYGSYGFSSLNESSDKQIYVLERLNNYTSHS